MMFDRLGRDPNETLSAFFVPFRSQSFERPKCEARVVRRRL